MRETLHLSVSASCLNRTGISDLVCHRELLYRPKEENTCIFFFNVDNMLEILHFEVRNALESTAKLLTEQIKELLFCLERKDPDYSIKTLT